MSGVSFVRVVRDGPILRVALNRVEARNALSSGLIEELGRVFVDSAAEPGLRAVVLSGEGQDFCVGADLGEMRKLGNADFAENLADAERLAATFRAIHDFPRPVVARVHGNVFGGGAGIVAACDIAIAANDARFAFSEVRLGILPAVISPYVLRRLSDTDARRLFLTGERFDGTQAAEIGLVSQSVDRMRLDETVAAVVAEVLQGSPDAQRRIKRLLDEVSRVPLEVARRRTAQFIAEARASAEGREGLRAFAEKRRPSWASDD